MPKFTSEGIQNAFKSTSEEIFVTHFKFDCQSLKFKKYYLSKMPILEVF